MNVAVCPQYLNILSICTGGAGLDLGVELAIPSARTVCMVEREAFAVTTLVSAMEQGLLHPAPIWSDARTFNGRAWRGAVDGLIGGIPCQPHSVAGRKEGQYDARDLWSDARRIIVQSGAWFALIENVGGMLSAGDDEIAGAQRVFRDLSKLGFAVEGGLFKAREVGAPHGRERIFILAVADSLGIVQSSGRSGEVQGARCATEGKARLGKRGRHDACNCGECFSGVGLADSCGTRLQGSEFGRASSGGNWSEASGSAAEFCCTSVGYPVRKGSHATAHGGLHRFEEGSRPWDENPSGSGEPMDDASIARGRPISVQPRRQDEAGCNFDRPGLFPPGPADGDAWRSVLERSPHLEPSVRRVADGMAAHVDELRMLGNGVVPLQAAYALRTLAARLAARGSAGAARLVRLMEEMPA
ncbi:DNA cytosine methyltransferase [Agrobacterium rhizogenes]|uniref:DNA cytosine methyltransferase n=1 Tax=Rhizobium rhizogenes TaxID=359 RepID=UPI0015735063|nr:DNA cytosine methyltransferase [Rhizobium rhizogenes]